MIIRCDEKMVDAPLGGVDALCSPLDQNRASQQNIMEAPLQIAQQAKENIKPCCKTCLWHRSGAEVCIECVEFSWWQRV